MSELIYPDLLDHFTWSWSDLEDQDHQISDTNISSTYFSTEMKITKQNGCLWAGNNQNDKYQKQKSIHIIDLWWPNRIQNKK